MPPFAVSHKDDEEFYGNLIVVSLHDWFPTKRRHWKLAPLDDRWEMPSAEPMTYVAVDCSMATAALAKAVEVVLHKRSFS